MPDPPIPPQALTAALAARESASRDEVLRILEAAGPHLAAAERERLYAELGNDHYVIFTEDRWTIEHSVECRLSGHMPECAYHAAVARIADEYDPDRVGRWRIDGIDSEGLPALLRKDQP